MRDKQIHAPYNFVPFPNKVIRRYARLEDIPRQDCWQEGLCSGEIRITLQAETPVFVSNGDKDHPDFFRDDQGHCMIPGSSLRGLVRENMQILGLGLVRPGEDFQDVNLYYRALADAKGALRAPLKERYRSLLGIGNDGMPTQVRVGYLHRESPKHPMDTGYYIVPAKTTPEGAVVRIERTAPQVQVLHQKDCYPFREPVFYRLQKPLLLATELSDGPGNLEQGYVIGPGWMKGQNHLYLIPAEDPNGCRIPISWESLLAYQEDYETRKNSLGGTQGLPPRQEKEARQAEMDRRKQFWALPQEGEFIPVFYLEDTVVSFSPSSYYLRIAYRYPLHQGLPRSHQRRSQEALFLDYPYAMLGFAQQQGTALRSRVSFGDLRLTQSPRFVPQISGVLGQPKLSFFGAYVQRGADYNRDDFQFRGYKQYWLRPPVPPEQAESVAVNSTLRPLDQGSSFSGTIRYQNLHPDELGLLLWCLRLEKGCYQPIGMGKPLGYGRMKLSIDALQELHPRELYQSLTPPPAFFGASEDTDNRVDVLIRTYQRWLRNQGGKDGLNNPAVQDIYELEGIQEFFTIRSLIVQKQEPVSYMTLGEYQNVLSPLDTIGEVARQAAPEPPAASGSAPGDNYPVGTRLLGKVTQVDGDSCTLAVPGKPEPIQVLLQDAGPQKGTGKKGGGKKSAPPPRKGQTVTVVYDGRHWKVT